MQAKVSHWHPNLSNSNIIFCVYFLFLHNLNMVNYVTRLLLCKEHYLPYCSYQSCTFFFQNCLERLCYRYQKLYFLFRVNVLKINVYLFLVLKEF